MIQRCRSFSSSRVSPALGKVLEEERGQRLDAVVQCHSARNGHLWHPNLTRDIALRSYIAKPLNLLLGVLYKAGGSSSGIHGGFSDVMGDMGSGEDVSSSEMTAVLSSESLPKLWYF